MIGCDFTKARDLSTEVSEYLVVALWLRVGGA